MNDTWTQTKSPRMFRLRRGEYTVIICFLVNRSATLRVYRKGELRLQDLCLRYEDIFEAAEAALNQAIVDDTAPPTRRPALLPSPSDDTSTSTTTSAAKATSTSFLVDKATPLSSSARLALPLSMRW